MGIPSLLNLCVEALARQTLSPVQGKQLQQLSRDVLDLIASRRTEYAPLTYDDFPLYFNEETTSVLHLNSKNLSAPLLMKVLSKCKNLMTLHLGPGRLLADDTAFGGSVDQMRDLFCSPLHLPELTELCVEVDIRELPSFLETVVLASPNLRTARFAGFPMSYSLWVTLGLAASHLEVLEAAVAEQPMCLSTLAAQGAFSQLRELRLSLADNTEQAEIAGALNAFVTRLAKLEVLHLPAVAPPLPLRQLTHLTALRELGAWIDPAGLAPMPSVRKLILQAGGQRVPPHVASQFPNLETLTVQGAAASTEWLSELLSSVRSLHTLDLSACTAEADEPVAVVRLVLHQPSLVHVALPLPSAPFADMLPDSFHHVKSLTLVGACARTLDAFVQAVLDRAPALELLDLAGCKGSCRDVLLTALAARPSLRVRPPKRSGLSTEELKRLTALDRILPSLTGAGARSAEYRVLLLGVNDVGKTTLLYQWKLGFNVETVQIGSAKFTIWDVGGSDKIRALWRHYFDGTKVLAYVLSLRDFPVWDEQLRELDRVAHALAGVPVVVICTHVDGPGHTVDEVEAHVRRMSAVHEQPITVIACNALDEQSARHALDAIAEAATA